MKFFGVLVTLAVLLSGVSSHFWVYRLRSNDVLSRPNHAEYQFFTLPPEDCEVVLNVKITPGWNRKDSEPNRRLDMFSLRTELDSIEWVNDMGFFGTSPWNLLLVRVANNTYLISRCAEHHPFSR